VAVVVAVVVVVERCGLYVTAFSVG
jgi:hypothetical protein